MWLVWLMSCISNLILIYLPLNRHMWPVQKRVGKKKKKKHIHKQQNFSAPLLQSYGFPKPRTWEWVLIIWRWGLSWDHLFPCHLGAARPRGFSLVESDLWKVYCLLGLRESVFSGSRKYPQWFTAENLLRVLYLHPPVFIHDSHGLLTCMCKNCVF